MESFNIGAVAGVVLSLLFKYVPGLSDWYEGQDSQFKELFMLALMVGAVAAVYGLSCFGWLDAYACGQDGLREAVFALVGAVVGNQGAYSILSYQKNS